MGGRESKGDSKTTVFCGYREETIAFSLVAVKRSHGYARDLTDEQWDLSGRFSPEPLLDDRDE